MSSPKSSFTRQSPKLSFFHTTLSAAFESGDAFVHTKMPERTLVDLVQKIYEELGKGDIDAFMSFFTDDVVVDLHAPEEFGFKVHAEGKTEARDLILSNFAQVELQAPQIRGLVAQGDTVIVTLSEIGVVRATARPYSVRVSQQFTFRGGKIWRFSQIAAVE